MQARLCVWDRMREQDPDWLGIGLRFRCASKCEMTRVLVQGDDHGTGADDAYAEPPHGKHHHSRWRELLPGLLTHQRHKGYRRVAWADEDTDQHGGLDEGVLHPDAPTNGRRPLAGAS